MNKKVIAMMAAVLTAFSGCASNATAPEQITVSEVLSSLTETEAPVTESIAETTTEAPSEISETMLETTAETSETTAEEPAEAEPVDEKRASYDSGAERFLEALGSGTAGEFIYADYDFLKNITLSDYSFELLNSDDYEAQYAVTIDVSDSSDEYIPPEKSEWLLTIGYSIPTGYVVSFYPADIYPEGWDGGSIYDTFEEGSAMYEAANIAYNISFLAGIFDTNETPLDEWVPDETSGHRFFHTIDLDYENGVTPEQLSEAVKKEYGLTLPADKINMKIDEDGFLPKDCAHGWIWTLYDIVNYSSDENEIMIELVFYGDEARFYPVKQSKYYFDINEDNSVSLRSVEKVFDKGDDIVRLSV